MACEVGLYYVLHVAKQRNKNALLRLLPGLGECASPTLLPPRLPASCPTLLTAPAPTSGPAGRCSCPTWSTAACLSSRGSFGTAARRGRLCASPDACLPLSSVLVEALSTVGEEPP